MFLEISSEYGFAPVVGVEPFPSLGRHGHLRRAFSSGALRVVTCRHLTPVTL